MLLINFSHPLTDDQRAAIESLTGVDGLEVRDMPTQFDPHQSFIDQVRVLVDSIGLSANEWQSTPLIVNPPSLSVIGATLLAELHGRMGYFPPVVRLRRIEPSLPPRFEVAELINLQAVRDAARGRR